jgi:hypothetical protein
VADEPVLETETPQEGNEEDEELEIPEGDSLPREVVEKARKQAAKYRTERNDLKQFVDGLGGRDYVERLITATRTSEGVAQLFLEAGRSFGLSEDALRAMLEGKSDPASTVKPLAGDTDDDDDETPLTKKQLRELEARLKEEIAKPLSQQRAQDLAAQGARVIHETLEDLDITAQDDKKRVMRYVAEYMPEAGTPDEFNPQVLAAAVRRGYEDFNKDAELMAKNYREKKREAAGAPASLGNSSGAPTFKLPKEPRNSAEATQALEEWLSKQERGA